MHTFAGCILVSVARIGDCPGAGVVWTVTSVGRKQHGTETESDSPEQ